VRRELIPVFRRAIEVDVERRFELVSIETRDALLDVVRGLEPSMRDAYLTLSPSISSGSHNRSNAAGMRTPSGPSDVNSSNPASAAEGPPATEDTPQAPGSSDGLGASQIASHATADENLLVNLPSGPPELPTTVPAIVSFDTMFYTDSDVPFPVEWNFEETW
jgi:hypothetical protein